MEYQAFTLSQAANELGVSPSSVRRLCAEFAGHLSDGANPGKGGFRRLSKGDPVVLSEVTMLKAQGLSAESIGQQLGSMVFHTDIEPAQAAQEAHRAAIVSAVLNSLQAIESQRQQIDTVDALQNVIAPLTANDEAIANRLDALECEGK